MSDLKELIWYAVDFDGTLATKKEDYSIGEPIKENIDKLWEVVEAGYKIIIYTSRHWGEYIKIEKWLNDNGIPFKAIICGKPLCFRYVDDRAISAYSESWL